MPKDVALDVVENLALVPHLARLTLAREWRITLAARLYGRMVQYAG